MASSSQYQVLPNRSIDLEEITSGPFYMTVPHARVSQPQHYGILNWEILRCGEGCPVHRMTSGSIPGLPPLKTNQLVPFLLLHCDKQKYVQTLPSVPWEHPIVHLEKG